MADKTITRTTNPDTTVNLSTEVTNKDATKGVFYLSNAAKGLYLAGYTAGVILESGETVNDLTNSEIARICGYYMWGALKEQARSYYVNVNKDTAGTTAEAEADANLAAFNGT